MRIGQRAFHAGETRPEARGERSGVAGGQVEATKYVEFRYIAASFFTWYVCKFHKKHQIYPIWVGFTVIFLRV